MKILMVNEFVDLRGGAERYLIALCEHLVSLGVRVDILHGHKPERKEVAKADHVYRIPELGQEHPALDPGLLLRLKDLLLQSRPDVIYVHNLRHAGAILHLASVAPTFQYVHDHKASCPDGKRLLHFPLSPCAHPISPFCMLRAHFRRCMPRSPGKAVGAYLRAKGRLSASCRLRGLLVASTFMEELLRANGVPHRLITVLPLFTPWPVEKWTTPENPNGLLYVGRLAQGKGILELITWVSRMQDSVHLEIVGDGDLLEGAARMIRENGLDSKIHLMGPLRDEALRAAYRRNAVLVLPSVWPEPFGLVGLEAASLGRPAVAFDVGGISQWLKDGQTGRLVPPGDFRQMRDTLSDMLGKPERLKTLGIGAIQQASESFSLARHAAALLDLFDRALTTSPERRAFRGETD